MKQFVNIILFLCISCIFLILFNIKPSSEKVYKNVFYREKNYIFDDKLFDIKLKYLLQSNVCDDNSNILAVILVTSYFGNVEARSAMRRAFSAEDLNNLGIKRVFLLGEAPKDIYTKQNAIENESRRFNDILQGNFMEAYRNLTYKHMMGIKWVNRYCTSAKYVIKMDDDIVVNLKKIVHMLKIIKLPKKPIAGYILNNMTPIREPANKWYVTMDEYNKSNYPQFVSGWFYITTPQVCMDLEKESKNVPYFWIDDVYITGILPKYVKIRLYDLKKIFTVHPEFLQCCMNDQKKYNFDCDILIGPNGGDNNLYYTFNNQMKECDIKKCLNRTKSLDDTCVAERKFNLGKGNAKIDTYRLVK